MINEIWINPEKMKERWVAHLDILGISKLHEAKRWQQVFSVYADSLRHFRGEAFDQHLIGRISFSDSFIIYAADNSAVAYRALDRFVRKFIVSLLQIEVPIRGAMSCGSFYADLENNIFFGQALVEAYRVGESQDWLGFVLCESATKQLDLVGLPANERLNYAYWSVPFKSKKLPYELRRLPAFIIGAGPSESGQRLCREALHRMKTAAKEEEICRKYTNTLEFLEKTVRTFPAT